MHDLISEGVHDKNIFKAIFVVGSPGAGKTTMVTKMGLAGLGLKLMDPDVGMVHFLKKAGLSLKYSDDVSDTWDKLHRKSTAMDDKFKKMYMDGMLGLLITGTGSRIEKITNAKKELEAVGYQCYIIFVNCDLQTALERNSRRDRSIDPLVVRQKHNAYMRNAGELQREFGNDRFMIVDTSDTSAIEIHGEYYYKQIQKWLREPISKLAQDTIRRINGERTKS